MHYGWEGMRPSCEPHFLHIFFSLLSTSSFFFVFISKFLWWIELVTRWFVERLSDKPNREQWHNKIWYIMLLACVALVDDVFSVCTFRQCVRMFCCCCCCCCSFMCSAYRKPLNAAAAVAKAWKVCWIAHASQLNAHSHMNFFVGLWIGSCTRKPKEREDIPHHTAK